MDADIVSRVRKCVAQVLAVEADEVRPESRLMDDLGADSLDLVELMFVLEQEFSIKLEQDDLSLSAQLGLADGEIHVKEVLTPRALELLRERYPHARELLKEGVVRRQLAALLTVSEIARSIAPKVAAAA